MRINTKIMEPVIFHPSGKKAQPDGRQTVLQMAQSLEIPLQSSCGGKKKCGKCKVIVEAAEGLLPLPSDREKETLGILIEQGFRLACKTVLTSGARIRIPDESLIQAPVILTADTGQSLHLSLKPAVEPFYVEVPEPDLNSVKADEQRLLEALEETYGFHPGSIDYPVLKKLPETLRSGKGVTAVIRNRKEALDLNPGRQDQQFGMAFDIGTTTVVGYLYDLTNGRRLSVQSDLNPQIAFGDEVISRIAFCRKEPQGVERLRGSIVQCLNRLIAGASAEAHIDGRRIMEVTVVGNTVMHHLFLGLDPRYLAMAPFPPVLQTLQNIKARDLGLNINPAAYAALLPLKAGFVGSDIIAGILACGLHKQGELTLFLDLGTNGEIVLGCKKRLVCCSTAAGPAFEGGHIRWGMRASKGAIEEVKIEPGSLNVFRKTIGDHPPAGICGSGIISALAEMIRRGVLSVRGNFNPEMQSPRLRTGKDGSEFVLAWADETAPKEDIVITRKDVAEVQMAKSAIYAGTVLLQEFLGEKPIKRIYLAGAFGNYVDPRDALTLGLFPEGEAMDLRKMGNTAGYGACLALLNTRKRKEAERISRKMEYLELAAHRRFQEVFVSGLYFRSASDYADIF
jgi:uncharacterized 2Fe-2S/4Fe-4S cluster protein (DUF4445 family)